MCELRCCCVTVSILIAISGIVIYFCLPSIMFYSDTEKCPYCYGDTCCAAFRNGEISTSRLSILNVFNHKNIFHGQYNNVDVIIKKLANTDELSAFDSYVCLENNLHGGCDLGNVKDDMNYTKKIMEYMDDNNSLLKPLKVCSKDVAKILFHYFIAMKPDDVEKDVHLKNVWTILKINVEPLILQLLNLQGDWPIPKYYGSCGRLAVMENRGHPLNRKADSPWTDRAYLALQLLWGAKNFTFDHPHLRFYLTDISSDNIAVDDALKLTFVDLEHLVVFHENGSSNTRHNSEVIHDSDGFAYVQDDLCNHSISDHNYYAICKLLLSKDAPFPMMKNGLLHSPPVHIVYKYKELFDLIEDCSNGQNGNDRFESAKKIVDILNEILSKDKHNNRTTVIA